MMIREGRTPMRFFITAAVLFTATTAYAVSYPVQPPKGLEEITAVEGVRFNDAQGPANFSSIPKTWKLISVSTGEKNSNNLWFQDADGSVYLVQGSVLQNRLIIHEQVYKIPAR
jgi:hypothetical protein